jgi:cytochrome c peroxidase
MSQLKYLRILLLASIATLSISRAEPDLSSKSLGPGYGSLEFSAPEPGSYELPLLGLAANGKVLDTQGNTLTLHNLMGDKVVLLSFIYSTCNDINGCPLATTVLQKIKSRLKKEPELNDKLRLITISFNPEQDTPEIMSHYGQAFQDQGIEWRFLTTQSPKELQPILEHYKQSIQKIYDSQGKFTGTFSHLLRVYLIDKNKQIRNIYSVTFLHPDTLINDIKTLLHLKPKQNSLSLNPQKAPITNNLYAPGDNKSNYQQIDYVTQSIALPDRIGHSVNLLKTVNTPPLGLPTISTPNNNPLTKDKISLGQKLFYDRRLSFNNTFSCAMCHVPEQGFTSNEMATAIGIEGRTVRRNSPTLFNVAYAQSLFHDSRESTLEQQVWSPLLAHNEMANPSIGYVIDKINNSIDYKELFKKAFGKEADMETIGMAIACYERTLNSANSAFDQWFYKKDQQALDVMEKRGFQLFTGKAKCSSCHTITKNNALFTDHNNHNTGIGYNAAMSKPNKTQQVQIAPGIYTEVSENLISTVSEPKANDLGRYEITQKPQDLWKYKTPTLRNIELTAPYMHNGTFETLKQVVEFYNRGGIVNENLDPLIKPLNLTESEITDLTAFLKSLTGDNVNELVADAFSSAIGDTQ